MQENTNEELQLRIRDLEKEVARLHAQIKKQRYGLVWLDVPEGFESETENKIPILEEVKDKAIKNDDGKPTHILIEGDNYHALTCLNYTHKGKIDVIYIDPPYNTGSDGFTYKDKRILKEFPDGTPVPKDHPMRHSYWLSFMSKRLELAKNLLSDKGVIFISINEEEYSQLKLLCDKIFGETNYITTFTIKVRHEDRILKGDKPIHETTEQLLMFQKSPSFEIQKRKKDNSSPDEYIYVINETIDNPEIIEMGSRKVEVFYPGQYTITKKSPDFSNLKQINIRGSIKTGNSSGRFHMAYLEQRNNQFNVLYKVPNMGDDGLGYRYFLSRSNEKKSNGFYFQGAPIQRKDIVDIPYPNFFDFEDEFNNVGKEGGVPFGGGKKPIEFIKSLLRIATNKTNPIVLDFFAGSGSAGHAILDFNKSGNNAQFILVQSNDNTYEIKNDIKIAKGNPEVFNGGFDRIVDVTYQRCKNVICGYQTTNQQVEGLGNSLKYYKTGFVGKNNSNNATDSDKVELSLKAGYLLALAENTLEEVSRNDFYQIFEDGKGRITAVYFKGSMMKFGEFSREIESWLSADRKNTANVYIFCWGDVSIYENEFEDMSRISLKAIPKPILDIYKSINC